jgi:hypothetical protein
MIHTKHDIWHILKEQGAEAEEQVQLLYSDIHNDNTVRIQTAKNYKKMRYDVKTEQGRKIEVKNDIRATITGNIYIEMYDKRRQPSGLNITNSTLHVIKADGVFYEISTHLLKDIIKNGKYYFYENYGYNGIGAGYIIPLRIFKKYAIIIASFHHPEPVPVINYFI